VRVAVSAWGESSRRCAAKLRFRFGEQGLRQRDHGFLLAAVGEARHRLADGNDLAGLSQGGGDHAGGVGLEVGIVELVLREVERAPGAVEAALCLVARRLLALEVRRRRPTLALELCVTLEIRRSLREVRGGGGELGRSALNLQPQVLGIEARHHVADLHAVADIDDAGDDLAGDAEAEIGLVARPHHADELARGVRPLEGDALHQHGPRHFDGRRGVGLTAGQNEKSGKGHQRAEQRAPRAIAP
jgi:hypothetical protein